MISNAYVWLGCTKFYAIDANPTARLAGRSRHSLLLPVLCVSISYIMQKQNCTVRLITGCQRFVLDDFGTIS